MQEIKDILAFEAAPWHFMENVAIELADIYGYQEVRTPILERAELFTQCMGSNSNLVERELWVINDKQGKRTALRANMFLPSMRAIVERGIGMHNTDPEKFYFLGPVLTNIKGNGQAVRQSNQFGVGSVGSSLPSLDVEAMMLAYDFFNALGLTELRVRLNSVGCKKCRAEYQKTLYDYYSNHANELCAKCAKRYKNHSIWTMGCKEKRCHELSQVAPSIFGCLCTECRDHFEGVKAYLKELKINYSLYPMLVPDVEFCDRTVFEISCGEHVLAHGGRCDSLYSMICDLPHTNTFRLPDGCDTIPAVGCTVDMDAVLESIKEAHLVPELSREIDVCLAGSSQNSVALLLPVLYALRRAGIYAELAYPETVDGTALETASKSSAKFVIYLDDSSLNQRVVRFREKGDFRDIRLNDALNRIGRYFGISGLVDELRPVNVRKFSISRRQNYYNRPSYEIFEPSKLGINESSVDEEVEKQMVGGTRHKRRSVSSKDKVAENETAKNEAEQSKKEESASRHSLRSRRGNGSRRQLHRSEDSLETEGVVVDDVGSGDIVAELEESATEIVSSEPKNEIISESLEVVEGASNLSEAEECDPVEVVEEAEKPRKRRRRTSNGGRRFEVGVYSDSADGKADNGRSVSKVRRRQSSPLEDYSYNNSYSSSTSYNYDDVDLYKDSDSNYPDYAGYYSDPYASSYSKRSSGRSSYQSNNNSRRNSVRRRSSRSIGRHR